MPSKEKKMPKKSDAQDVAEQGWNTRMFIRAGKPVFSFDQTDQKQTNTKPLPPKSPTKAPGKQGGKPAQAPGSRPSDRAVYQEMDPDSGDMNQD